MRRQRNMSQPKEENKAPEKYIKKMGTSNLPDAEFKTLVIRMLSELRGRELQQRDGKNKNGDRKHKTKKQS